MTEITPEQAAYEAFYASRATWLGHAYRDFADWDKLSDNDQADWKAAVQAARATQPGADITSQELAAAMWESEADAVDQSDPLAVAQAKVLRMCADQLRTALAMRVQPAETPEPAPVLPDGGQWMHIGFFGRIELEGYVTEITVGGQPVFHIDLPEKIWGGNPLNWEEYAANALHNRRPLTEDSVRKAYEARLASERERARRQAEWERQQRQYALEAAGSDDDDEPDDLTGRALYPADDDGHGGPF